ncbi:MAG: ACT domain-containing protein [Eudoraea sp.]|nr:ACT domain-containing protein [Eudoraea sp.]
MNRKSELNALIRDMQPELHPGQYVFISEKDPNMIGPNDIIGLFREKEGTTVIIEQPTAEKLGLPYDFLACWITLNVHSSLQAVGLTAAFSAALAKEGISCNVIAAFYHDHIFVAKADAGRAMEVLKDLSAKNQ